MPVVKITIYNRPVRAHFKRLNHLQKSWLIYEAIRAQVVKEVDEIAVQRAQGIKDSRGRGLTK